MASGGPSGLSHVQILTSSEYTLRRCLDLQKVVPALLKQKSLPKRFRLAAKLAEKRVQLGILLGAVKELDLDGFALFLEALDSLQDEKHNEALSVLSTEIRFMSLPPEAQSTEVIERIVKAHYHETVTKDEPEVVCSSQSTPSVEEQPTPEVQVAVAPLSVLSPPLPPPNLTLGNVESQTFTKAGGTFYSPTHGVKVHIPQKSLPPTVQPFELRMTASLRGPYKFPQDCELCTAIIHLECEPPIGQFCDWVTVEIPHCVTEVEIEGGLDHLCIMSARDELISEVYEFREDPDMEVDFSDTYKVVFKTKHFSKSAGVRRQCKDQKRTQNLAHGKQKPKSQHQMILRERKQRSLDFHYKTELDETSIKMRSMSLPSSATSHPDPPQGAASTALLGNEYCIGNEYSVAMCTPNDRSQPQWNAVFLVSYSHSTGWMEIMEAARRILGNSPNLEMVSFVFDDAGQTGRYVEFVPESWQSDGWKVESVKRPAMITERDVVNYVQLPGNMRKALNFCPNRLLYDVDGRNMTDVLKLPIHVTNATCHNGGVSFLLTSTTIPSLVPASDSSLSEQRKGPLRIISELYDDQSHFWQVLSNNITQDVPLSIDNNNIRKFLVEISFQLPNWHYLAKELQLDQSVIDCLAANHQNSPWQFEAAYQMLRKWLTQKPLAATLANLLATLRALGFTVKPSTWQTHFQQTPCSVDARGEFGLFACELAGRIGSQWKFVARQLGVAEHDIDVIAVDHQEDGVVEQAHQMLLKWKMMNSKDATYGVLMDAIHAVNEHTCNLFNDACHFTVKHIRHLMSVH